MQTDRQATPPKLTGYSPRFFPSNGYIIVLYQPGGVVTATRCREELGAVKATAERMARPHATASFRIIDDNGCLVWHSAG
jgi:hypothetical protein